MIISKKKIFFATLFVLISIASIVIYKRLTTVTHLSQPIESRGKIIAENGQILAYSDFSYDILLDFKLINNINDINKLADSILSITVLKKFNADKLYFKKQAIINFNNRNRYFLITQDLDKNQMLQMKNWVAKNIPLSKKALIVEQKLKRFYPFNDNAARSIGKCNVIGGQTGIEYAYNNYLENNNLPNQSNINWEIDSTYLSEHNFDVVTSLNIDLSAIVTDALNEKLISSNAKKGLCIIQESNTGKIVSMVNLGKTDIDNYKEIRNYALLNIQPGNLIKPIIAPGLFSSLDKIDTALKLKHIENYLQKNNDKTENEIVKHLSTNRLKNYFEGINFNATSGIDLAGEQLPMLKLFRDSLSNELSISALEGKEDVGLSPIKLCSYYSAIANNGIFNVPFVVTKLISHKDNSTHLRAKRTPVQLINTAENNTLIRCLNTEMLDSTRINYITDNNKIMSDDKLTSSLQDVYLALFKIKNTKYTMLICINDYKENGMANPSGSIAKKIIQSMLNIGIK